jgi:hypothetical protein
VAHLPHSVVNLCNINFNGSDHGKPSLCFGSRQPRQRVSIFRGEERFMTGTPDRIRAARDAWLAARDAWLAAIAALEAHRLEVNRLWLEYLELADPMRARKIRRILERGEQVAAKTADELFPAAVYLGRSIPRPQELRHEPSHNHPRMASTPLRSGAD